MKIDNKELYNFLKGKGIEHLFHANTVATSITYIENGGLLSRDWVERSNLYQTSQSSDEIDKLFDVFDDVFLDTEDLHKYFSRQNHYGPVLFKFNIDMLLEENLEIWVTKDNPIYWDKKSKTKDNYFVDVNELSNLWTNHDKQRKMITVKKPTSPILFNYLEEICLDNPKVLIHDDVSLRVESKRALEKAIEAKKELEGKLVWRQCGHCFCTDNYLKQVPTYELARKFLPLSHAKFED
ncbi:hypothetical protein [Vibrio harveyi]|uniref:hypothetical protein n=1 Tax=Vibrio harveyi TaxID=669 RepID=UPI003399AE62